jgi:hypothetical protein
MARGVWYPDGSRVVAGKRCTTCGAVGSNTPFDRAHKGHDVEPAVIGRAYKNGSVTNEYHELPKKVLKNPNTVVATMKKGNQWRGTPGDIPGTWVKTPKTKNN